MYIYMSVIFTTVGIKWISLGMVFANPVANVNSARLLDDKTSVLVLLLI